MSRQRRSRWQREEDKAKGVTNSMGGQQTDLACRRVDELCQIQARASLPFPFTDREFVMFSFPHEVLGKLQQAYMFVNGGAAIEPYYEDLGTGVQCHLNAWDRILCLPPKQEHFAPRSDILAYMSKLDELFFKFAVVKHCITWLNRRATLGAIRYYLPTITGVLGPNDVDFPSGDGSFKPPLGIAGQLPLIREANETLSMAYALSKVIPESAKNMPSQWHLQFSHPLVSRMHYSIGIEVGNWSFRAPYPHQEEAV